MQLAVPRMADKFPVSRDKDAAFGDKRTNSFAEIPALYINLCSKFVDGNWVLRSLHDCKHPPLHVTHECGCGHPNQG